MSNAMEHAKGIFLCEVLTREVGEGVREIGSGRGALVQAPSLCRDGLRELDALAFDSMCRGEGVEELGVLYGSWEIIVGAPVTIPVKASSVVYKSISEQAQAMNNKRHYLVVKGLPTLGTILGITTNGWNNMHVFRRFAAVDFREVWVIFQFV